MSFDQTPRRAALLGLLALAGCGFSPLYGDPDARQGLISFDTPDSVAGYRLRVRLEDRLGMATAPRYQAVVTLESDASSATITSEGDTTRFNIVGKASWRLLNSETGAELGKGDVQTFTSYDATGSTVATQTAEADARARLSVALADMIVTRLLLLLRDNGW